MKVSIFQGVIIAIFILGALFGLIAFATYKGGGGGGGADFGTVSVWGTLPKDDISSALVEMGKKESALKNVSYTQIDEDALANSLATAIAVGSGPDLILASQENLLALKSFLSPIPSATLPESTFSTSFIDEAKILADDSGGHYGVPFLVDPLVLFVNNDLLASNGIVKPPSTWEGLVGLTPKLAAITPSKQVVRGLVGLGTYDNVRNARGILSALFLQTNVPLVTKSQGRQLRASLGQSGGSGGTPPGEAVLRFYTQFADPEKLSYTWNSSLSNSRQAFQTGDLALYLGYVSEAKEIRAANPNLNFSVSALPQPETASTKTTYGLLYSFMISRGAKNPSGAYKAAMFLARSNEQKTAAAITSLAPTSRTALAALPSDATLLVAYTSALYAKGWLSPAPAEVDKVFSSMIKDVTSGQSNPGGALTKAAAGLNLLY